MANDLFNPQPYATLSADQVSPFGGVLQKALANYKALTEARYQAPLAQQNLQQQIADTLVKQSQAQYAPQMNAADLSYKQEQTPALAAQAGYQTSEANKNNALMPGQALTQQITNQYLPQMQQADIEQKQASANYYNMGGGRAGVDQKALQGLKQQLLTEGVDPLKVDDVASTYLNGGDTLQDGSKIPPPSGAVTYFLNSMTKHTNTAAGLNQQRYANTLGDLFNKTDTNAAQAFQFAGIAGKVKGGVDALAAQVGSTDPNYTAYRSFVDEDVPALSTEILRAGGASSTDKQKATALSQAITMNISTNPALAQSEYNELKNLYKGIGGTISKGVMQTRNNLITNANSPTSTPTPNAPTAQPVQPVGVQWIRKNGQLVRAN